MSRCYGRVDIVFRRFGTFGQLRPVGRVVRCKPGAITGRDPFAINI